MNGYVQRVSWRKGMIALLLATGLAGLLPAQDQIDPAEYAQWKEQTIQGELVAKRALAASSGPVALAGSNFTITNQFMQLEVNGSVPGRFGLQTLLGDPAVLTDNNKTLIFGTYGSTCGLSVKINGTNTPLDSATPTNGPTLSRDGTYATTEWLVSGVLIRQRLELVDSGNGRADTVKMTYSLAHQSGAAKNVGLKVGIDTMIGYNDAARIATASGIITNETGYGLNGAGGSYTNAVPDYWQAFEVNNLAAPGLVARGTLVGGGATKPDKFVAGQWSAVSTSANFDYVPSGSTYWDSAIGIWWLNRTLNVGQTLTFVTYYGLGAVTGVGGALALGVTAPASLAANGADFNPNPFTVNAIVQNNTVEVMAPVTVTITLPDGLSLAGIQTLTQTIPSLEVNAQQLVSWQVLADPSYAGQTLAFDVDALGGDSTPHVELAVILPALSGSNFVNVLTVGYQTNALFPAITAKVFVNTDAGWNCRLTASDFTLQEDDVAQVLDSVECSGSSEAAADVAFVFDDTGSMSSYIATLQEQATAFANSIVGENVDATFGLISFKDTPELKLQLTNDVASFQDAVNALYAEAGDDTPEVALDGVMMAITQMQWRASAQRVIVLITDAPTHYRGDDTEYSSYIMPEVITAIRNAGATMLVVSPDEVSALRLSVSRDNLGQVVRAPSVASGVQALAVRSLNATTNSELVKLLATETGGMWSDINTSDFSAFISRVADVVTSTYTLRYHTSNTRRDGTVRHVEVTVTDPDAGLGADTGTYTAPLSTTVVMTMAVIGAGSVSPAAGAYSVPTNIAQSISATATTGWHFGGWSATAGVTLGNATSTITTARLRTNATVTATFAINRYPVVFHVTAGGTIVGTSSQMVNYGANSATVNARTNVGYRFVNWTYADGSVYATSTTVSVSNVMAATHLDANFAKLLPDFVVMAIALDPPMPTIGGTFAAYVRVRNDGDLAGSIGNLGVWTNKPGPNVAAKTIANKSVQGSGTLRPGQTALLVVSGLSAGTGAGTRTLRAFVDAANATVEGNETNNQMTLTYTVAQPDFVVTALEVSPDYLDAGKPFTAYVTVKNISTVAGDAGILDVWSNRTGTPTATATGAGNKFVTVGVLAAGEEKRFAVAALTAPLRPVGQVQVVGRVQVLIDGRAKTAELSESNNAMAFDYLAK